MYKDLFYNQQNGELIWGKSKGRTAKKGNVAGTITKHGYMLVTYNGKGIMAHRIVYEKYYNINIDWNKFEIDHIDGDRLNNRIENLRVVNREVNMKNKKKYQNNTSGIVGVYFNEKLTKWQGQVRHNTKAYYCGVFTEKEDCIKAVEAKRKEFGFHENHGRS